MKYEMAFEFLKQHAESIRQQRLCTAEEETDGPHYHIQSPAALTFFSANTGAHTYPAPMIVNIKLSKEKHQQVKVIGPELTAIVQETIGTTPDGKVCHMVFLLSPIAHQVSVQELKPAGLDWLLGTVFPDLEKETYCVDIQNHPEWEKFSPFPSKMEWKPKTSRVVPRTTEVSH